MRINQFIAHAGVSSRRKAEDLIKSGQVKVNGSKLTDLTYQVTGNDLVEVNGQQLRNEEYVYFMLNKPRGVISAVTDDKGRPTVVGILAGVKERIYPVGRLDWDTSGLLLLTNDGDFANYMTHPSHQIDKTYIAKVEGYATKENLRPLTLGMKIEGQKISPARYKIIRTDKSKNASIVELTIHEGHNHQVKDMFETLGLPVQKLSRIAFGNLNLDGVPAGKYRELTRKEVKELVNLAK